MRVICETVEGERYLELVLTEKEAKKLLTLHLVACKAFVGGRVYSVGIRMDFQQGGEMPLVRGKSKKIISFNIREVVKTGHPKQQSVAAALQTAKKSRKKANKGKKSE